MVVVTREVLHDELQTFAKGTLDTLLRDVLEEVVGSSGPSMAHQSTLSRWGTTSPLRSKLGRNLDALPEEEPEVGFHFGRRATLTPYKPPAKSSDGAAHKPKDRVSRLALESPKVHSKENRARKPSKERGVRFDESRPSKETPARIPSTETRASSSKEIPARTPSKDSSVMSTALLPPKRELYEVMEDLYTTTPFSRPSAIEVRGALKDPKTGYMMMLADDDPSREPTAEERQETEEEPEEPAEPDEPVSPCSAAEGRMTRRGSRRQSRRVPESEWFHGLTMMIESSWFGYLTVGLVFVNSVVIGMQAEYDARHIGMETLNVFRVLDKVFLFVFSLEILMRVLCYGKSMFISRDWAWNTFDCVIVLVQLSEEIVATMVQRSQHRAFKASFLRLMRLMRLVRIARLVRVLRFFEELHSIMSSITASMKSLFWTMILLLFLLYSMGICITEIVTQHRSADGHHLQELDFYYGNLSLTVLSLFESITGGQSWDVMLRPLISEISPFMGIIFTLYISFCLFAFMNTITGVFCEKAMQNVQADEEEFLKDRVAEVLAGVIDEDDDGYITLEEFQGVCDTKEMREYFAAINVDIKHAEEIFRLADVEGAGKVECNEFVNQCIRLRGPATAIDLVMFMDQSGRIQDWLCARIERIEAKVDHLLKAVGEEQLAEDDEPREEAPMKAMKTGRLVWT